MRTLSYFMAAAWGMLTFGGCAHAPTRPLPTVSQVDLQRYAGKWYEMARLPDFFQRDDSNATAQYTPQAGGKVKVVNTEYRPDGSTSAIEGTATAVSDVSHSRLRVKFGGLAALAPVPKEGNYWIIKLEPDYSVVLVGTPDRKYLWVLARRPSVPASTMKRYVNAAKALGFDTSKLRWADWKERKEGKTPKATSS